jgi:hypothetical protein
MPVTTNILGIHQSDVIIRSALEQGMADLRMKPWLLDYVFASLPIDKLTKKKYGQATIDCAKEWFLANDVAVFMSTRTDKPKWPAISIKLASSNEDENTLGDVHYEPTEDNDLQWPALYGPFNPLSYDPFKGYVVLPDDVGDKLILFPGQLLVDGSGLIHPIEDVIDGQTIQIEKALTGNLNGSVIKGQPPAYIAEVESLNFKETYHIGCHVGAEQEQLTWLHSIVVFILLAYKETLLEARNFEKTTIQSSDFMQNPAFQEEVVFSRYVTISGSVRQVWPKSIKQKITAIDTDIDASPINLDGPVVEIESDALEATMTITDPRTFPFLYYGTAVNPGTIDAAFAQSLEVAAAPDPDRYITYVAGNDKYSWYVFPSAMGAFIGSESFTDARTYELAGFSKITSIPIDGVSYDVWRSNQFGLGTWFVQVKSNI